jgi:hypothetical protein
VTKPKTFEPTLALIECRLAALHQDRTFRPNDPLWVLFSNEEINLLFNPESTDGGR